MSDSWTASVDLAQFGMYQINVRKPLTVVFDWREDPAIPIVLQYIYLLQNRDYIRSRCTSADLLDFYFGPLRKIAEGCVQCGGVLVDWNAWKETRKDVAASEAFYLPSTRISSLITGRLLPTWEAVPAAVPFVHTDFAAQLFRFYNSQRSRLRGVALFPDLMEEILPHNITQELRQGVFQDRRLFVDDVVPAPDNQRTILDGSDLWVHIEPNLYHYFSWPVSVRAWVSLLLALYYVLKTECIQTVFIEQPQLGLWESDWSLVQRLITWLVSDVSKQVVLSTTMAW